MICLLGYYPKSEATIRISGITDCKLEHTNVLIPALLYRNCIVREPNPRNGKQGLIMCARKQCIMHAENSASASDKTHNAILREFVASG